MKKMKKYIEEKTVLIKNHFFTFFFTQLSQITNDKNEKMPQSSSNSLKMNNIMENRKLHEEGS